MIWGNDKNLDPFIQKIQKAQGARKSQGKKLKAQDDKLKVQEKKLKAQGKKLKAQGKKSKAQKGRSRDQGKIFMAGLQIKGKD